MFCVLKLRFACSKCLWFAENGETKVEILSAIGEDAELTQQEFAGRLNYSQATISRIESGEKTVSDKLLTKIEDAFQLNLDEYKKYEKNKKTATKKQEHDEQNAGSDDQDLHLHNGTANLEFERKYL